MFDFSFSQRVIFTLSLCLALILRIKLRLIFNSSGFRPIEKAATVRTYVALRSVLVVLSRAEARLGETTLSLLPSSMNKEEYDDSSTI